MSMHKDGDQSGEMPGYHTPGHETTLESTSDAVAAPQQTSEERIQDPKSIIQSIGETPGDANPAARETVAAEKGEATTAEVLMAREAAEEQVLRNAGASMYQDQTDRYAPTGSDQTDKGRPNRPDERSEEPVEYMESPRADLPLGSGTADKLDLNFKGRVDAMADRNSTQAMSQESSSGLPSTGRTTENDKYEQREYGQPNPPSDMDLLAPDAVNLAPEEENG